MIKTPVRTASLLCVGNQWFPTAPGGAERYMYELVHNLIKRGDRVELCATDLPASNHTSLLLTNLALTKQLLPQRLKTCRTQFQQRHL